MKKLFLDIGNSYIKAAVKDEIDWEIVFTARTDSLELFFSWLERHYEDRSLLVCSVRNQTSKRLENRFPEREIRVLNHKDIPGELMDYKTPQTLGLDRFFTCLGAKEITPDAAIVIDAGTACTIDYISRGTVFHGGVIMPGMQMQIDSMKLHLPSLPEADDMLPDEWPGRSSIDSVRWGAAGGFVEAVRGFLRRYEEKYGDFEIFLTGGGATFLKKHLAAEFKLKERQYLLFEGLEVFHELYL